MPRKQAYLANSVKYDTCDLTVMFANSPSVVIRLCKYSNTQHHYRFKQESLALASMARDDLPASSTAAAMRGKVGSEFET